MKRPIGAYIIAIIAGLVCLAMVQNFIGSLLSSGDETTYPVFSRTVLITSSISACLFGAWSHSTWKLKSLAPLFGIGTIVFFCAIYLIFKFAPHLLIDPAYIDTIYVRPQNALVWCSIFVALTAWTYFVVRKRNDT
jgi:hypothetical protein